MSVCQFIWHPSLNMNFHYLLNKIPLLFPITNLMITIHFLIFYLPRILLILYFHIFSEPLFLIFTWYIWFCVQFILIKWLWIIHWKGCEGEWSWLSCSISRYWDRLLKVTNLSGECWCSEWNIEVEPLRTEVARRIAWIAMCRAVKVCSGVILIFLLRVLQFLNLSF